MANLDQIAIEVSKLVNDYYDTNPEYNFTRWCKADLIHYAADGITMMFMLLPKKFTDVVDIPLVAGTVQKLPDNIAKLIKVLGTKNKFGVLSSITPSGDDRLATLFANVCSKAVDPQNYVMTGSTKEEASDEIFYVQPPVLPSQLPVTATIIGSVAPTDMDKDTEIEEWMHNAIIEWMLYRAYSSEDESTSSPQSAAMHLEHFYSIIANFKQAEKELIASQGTSNATSQQ